MNHIPKREGESFLCFICKETFEYMPDSTWSEKDAIKEYETNYPETQGSPVDVVCDDCHTEFRKWFATLTEEEKKNMREDLF
jgi:hypothetical protein